MNPRNWRFQTILAVLITATAAWAQTDDANGDWTAEYIAMRDTPEAELMVRVGSINNVGFGFPGNINPFAATEQWRHDWPWEVPAGAADGTDRIMLGSSYTGGTILDGYSRTWQADDDAAHTRPINIEYDLTGLQVRNALLQIVIDDFQALRWGSEFTVTLNGRAAPFISEIINQVEQTGPVVQIISIEVPESFLDEVASGRLSLFIDEVTETADGFAIDFVKLLVNYSRTEYVSQVEGRVFGADGEPLKGAEVRVLGTRNVVTTDEDGIYRAEVIAGLNAFRASHEGYVEGYTFAVTPAGLTIRPAPISLSAGEGNPDTNFSYFADGGIWGVASHWATAELALADELGLVPDVLLNTDMTQAITRAEFAAVIVRVYESLSGETAEPGADPFEDTDDVEVLKAFSEDLAVGISATEFQPDAPLNREQAATMLTRVVKKITFEDWTYATDDQYELEFADVPVLEDDGQISPWARESVYFMVATGVIADLQDNAFSPQASTNHQGATELAGITREQALVLAARLVERVR